MGEGGEGKKGRGESLVRVHSANKIDNYNRGGGKGKKEKNPKDSPEQIKK